MESRSVLDRPVRTDWASTRRKMIGRIAIGLFSLAILWINPAVGQQAPTTAAAKSNAPSQQTPQLTDRQREIALALSACPLSVASTTAVYVLEKSTNAELGVYLGPDGNSPWPGIVAREGTQDATITIAVGTPRSPSPSSASPTEKSSEARPNPGERQ